MCVAKRDIQSEEEYAEHTSSSLEVVLFKSVLELISAEQTPVDLVVLTAWSMLVVN